MDEAPPPSNWLQRFIRQVYTVNEGEFYAIGVDQARERLEKGWQWFEKRQWPVYGFVAPAWLMGEQAWQALGDFPFRYTTTRRRFYLLPERQTVPSQSLVYSVRSAWRRQMSSGWNTLLCAALEHAPLVRLSVHPQDVLHPQIVGNCQRFLERLLQSREAMTKARFAEAWGRQLAGQTAASMA
jgi:predicted deacetylase